MLLRHPSSKLFIPLSPTGTFPLPLGSTPKANVSPDLSITNKLNADGHLRQKSQANIKPYSAAPDPPSENQAIPLQFPRWKIGPAQQNFCRKGLVSKTCVNSPNTSMDNIAQDPLIQTPCGGDNHLNLNKPFCNGGDLAPKDNSVLKELPSWTKSKAKSILIAPKKTEKQRKEATPRRDPQLNQTISENAIIIDEETKKLLRNENIGSSFQENQALGTYFAEMYHMKITESQCSQSFAAKEKQLQNKQIPQFPGIEEEQGNIASFCPHPEVDKQNKQEYAQLKHEYDLLALEYAKAMDSEMRASEYKKKIVSQENEIDSLVSTIQELKSSFEKRENTLKEKIVILTQQVTLLTSGQHLKQRKCHENVTPLEKENEFLWKLLRCFQNQKEDECLNATQTSLLNETLQEGKISGNVNTIEIIEEYRSSEPHEGMGI